MMQECDVVVTNPPFSLFRDFVTQVIEYGKKFLLVGNNNAITYKEIFPCIKNGKIWLGVNNNKTIEFTIPKYYEKWNRIEDGVKIAKVPAISWFTNIPHSKRNLPLDLYKKYSPKDYPKYDNYDAINVDKTSDIPMDYDGVMGVPISFLDKYCPTQFEIVDAREIGLTDRQKNKSTMLVKDADSAINGKPTYARVLIRKIN